MDDPFVAPAPPEYAELTMERAMWKNFGQRLEDMTWLEYEIRSAALVLEGEKQKRDQERNNR